MQWNSSPAVYLNTAVSVDHKPVELTVGVITGNNVTQDVLCGVNYVGFNGGMRGWYKCTTVIVYHLTGNGWVCPLNFSYMVGLVKMTGQWSWGWLWLSDMCIFLLPLQGVTRMFLFFFCSVSLPDLPGFSVTQKFVYFNFPVFHFDPKICQVYLFVFP